VSRQLDFSRISPSVLLATAIGSIVALAALLSRVGSDAQWLAALGHVIAVRHAIPAGVPFAAAPTGRWPNPLVLAELIFAGLEVVLGDRGLMLAQLAAVAAGLAILAADARRGGAGAAGTGAALWVVAVGAMGSLAIARVQLFSLVLFPALVALLRAQARAPSRRIWLAVPLLAAWSNLHGAALLGLGVLIVYLVAQRACRAAGESVAVAVAATLALGLTPALARTAAYYRGVLTNVAAERGLGMWGPLSLHAPLDVLMVAAAGWLLWRLRRTGVLRWEWAVIAVLAVLTIRADRDGVWLLMFLAGPAARALHPERALRLLTPVALAAAAAALVVAVARGPLTSGAANGLVRHAIALAHGSPVLADGSIDEQVALDGGRIWAGNPIDAFSHPVQSAYLDWVSGLPAGAGAVTSAVRVVLVSRGSATQALMARLPGFAAARIDGSVVLYARTGMMQ
jgi:hypothetical protein